MTEVGVRCPHSTLCSQVKISCDFGRCDEVEFVEIGDSLPGGWVNLWDDVETPFLVLGFLAEHFCPNHRKCID